MRIVIDGAAIATVDAHGTEYASGHLVVADGVIESVGDGPAPEDLDAERRIDGRDCLITPGLVNTHHHLYQWASRGLAQDAILFDWLTALYPVWNGLDEEITLAAATAGLTRLAMTGATTCADHHYLFPADGGDQLGAVIAGAATVGLRLHAVRGSMDRGRSHGGLPPDRVVESTDDALAATETAIDRYHDTAPDARVRIAVGPCSPFSVSKELMTGAADLARRKGVRLHTHLAETVEEDQQCQAEYGCTPLEYAEQLGWLGDDVWLAHGIHFTDDAVRRLGATRTGIAHCPSSNARLGAGIARVADLRNAKAPVGLGADGAASNEDGGLGVEMRQAVYLARLHGGADAMSARDALRMATMGGAECLGRQDELGSLEPGKQADIAVWQLDALGQAGIADPVAALVLGPLPALRLLLVGGRTVVEDDECTGVSEVDVAHRLREASRRLLVRAEALR
ncbi:8-oxoguanine deaminase [Labedaea rhizosphaerae]|uniref:Cytosine/adenosine deaminase-related metal-dependent hydrolase n=1 Tax=Labedaea rhizosphaerae TaxID=598644 RepID=A0A4R6SHG4_LABRH|nr:8-oxoguanine deaminase [Labedaea rhizosphaerae]TDQ01057.1 cytosine/adenosine deaminase-related metal-dependent hydrolase [Labedaea rhizosphaerae]